MYQVFLLERLGHYAFSVEHCQLHGLYADPNHSDWSLIHVCQSPLLRLDLPFEVIRENEHSYSWWEVFETASAIAYLQR